MSIKLTQEEEKFIRYLHKSNGKSGQITLRRLLKYSRILFEKTKDSLVEKGVITLGKGKGGTVCLVDNLDILKNKNKRNVQQSFDIDSDEEVDIDLLFPIPNEESWQFQAMMSLEQLSKKVLNDLCGNELVLLLNSNLREIGKKKKGQ